MSVVRSILGCGLVALFACTAPPSTSSPGNARVTMQALTNVAQGKPAAASSSFDGNFLPGKAVDGSTGSGWSPAGGDSVPFWQVDLGQSQVIRQIEIVTRQDLDQPATRRNFEVWASNNADMNQGKTIICKQGGNTLSHQATFACAVNDTAAYRYVAVVKTAAEYFFLSEVRVLSPGTSSPSGWRNPVQPAFSADPYIVYFNGAYYLTATQGDSLAVRIRKASSIKGLSTAASVSVWTDNTPSRCCVM
jgi:hypothetical protein